MPHNPALMARETIDVHLASAGNYWQAWWTDARGRRRAKSLGNKAKLSRRQAEARCRDLAVDMRLGRIRDGRAPRLSQWITRYLAMRTDAAPTTLTLIEHTGRYLIQFFDNDPPIDRITQADAAAWRSALAAGELRGANVFPKSDDAVTQATRWHGYRKRIDPTPRRLSEATVCKHAATAKRIFSEATEEGSALITRNPFKSLRSRAPKPVRNWASIDPDATRRILDACPNPGWKALFALCRFAGLRRQEALDLRWCDVLWDSNRLTVNATIAHVTTKRAPRVVPIEPALCPTGLAAILRDCLETAADGAVRVCEGVSPHDLHRNAVAIIRRAGLDTYRKPFHTLRKCREGEIAAVYPISHLSAWMGHDVSVAVTHYLRVEESAFALPEVVKAH